MTRPQPRDDVDHRDPIEYEAEQDIKSWLSEIGTGHDIKITVVRTHPRTYKGVAIEGTCDSFSEMIDEDFIRERHGGGHYQIRVHKRDQKGRYQWAGGKKIKIAGPPKIDALLAENGDPEMAPSTDGTAVGQALAMSQWMTKQALEEKKAAERERQNGHGFDPAMISMIQAPMQAQMESLRSMVSSLQQALADKDAKILDLIQRRNEEPPGGRFQDRLFEKMVDGESARIEAIREQHASELRQLKEQSRHDVERERDRAEKELDALERRHARELEAAREAQRTASESQKIAYDTRIDGLKAEVSRLQGEVTALKQENGELRARKEKSLPEQAEEIVKIQEALKAIGVGGGSDEDDEDKGGVVERLVRQVLENPDAIGQLIGGVRTPVVAAPEPPPPVQPTQEQIAAAHQQRRRALAARKRRKMSVQVPAPDMIVEEGAPAPVEQTPEQTPALAEGTPSPRKKKLRQPDKTEVSIAIRFMEAAISNGTDPAVFAHSARASIPADILAYIEAVGVDTFLNETAQLDQDSVLRTQAGRNFARAVAKVLLEGM